MDVECLHVNKAGNQTGAPGKYKKLNKYMWNPSKYSSEEEK